MLVSRRTGGNPFFVAELGRLAGSAGRALPDAVLDTLRARLARLSAPGRAAARHGAAWEVGLICALAEVARAAGAQVLADQHEVSEAGTVDGGWVAVRYD